MSDEPKKKKEEAPKGAPAWMVTFSDMTTLLLTFFVLLLSFANTDLIKYKEALGSLKDAFGVQTLEIGNFQAQSPSPISLEAPTPKPFAIMEQEVSGGKRSDVQEDTKEGETVEEGLDKETKEMLEDVKKLIMDEGLLDELGVEVEQGNIHIRAKANIIFESGSVKIKSSSYSLLKKIAFLMKKTRYNLTVEGHTDSSSVRGSFPSNWELSSIRATTVLRFITIAGVDSSRIRPIGYADSRPLVPNTSSSNRAMNRRVEFVFTKDMWE